MKKCPVCSNEVSDDAKFCDRCGTKLVKTVVCPTCGKETIGGFAFCQNCGSPLDVSTEKPQPQSAPQNAPQNAPQAAPQQYAPQSVPQGFAPRTGDQKKRVPKLGIILGAVGAGLAVIVIVIIALFASGVFGKKSGQNFALYVKDREIFFSDLKKDSSPWQVTQRFAYVSSVTNENIASSGYYIAQFTKLSKDGSMIFYPDRIEENDEGVDLYFRSMKDQSSEPVKVDSDVRAYYVDDACKIITYIKSSEGNMYRYEIATGKKEKIASEVENFAISDNGNRILYYTFDNSIYIKYSDKDKEKMAGDITDIVYLTDDQRTVYYTKEEGLYKQTEGEERVKIASDIFSVIAVYESGEVYYLKEKNDTVSLADYVLDDMKEHDSKLTEPNRPQAPSWWDYDDDDEYEAAYDKYEEDYAKYEAAYYEYQEKLTRDSMRESLKEATLDRVQYSLCYYNGKEETVITESFKYGSYDRSAKTAVIVYSAFEQSDIKKVKLSEVSYYGEVRDMVEDALYSTAKMQVAVKNNASVIDEEDAEFFRINDSGTAVYFAADISDGSDTGELYTIKIENDSASTPELYDSDVYIYGSYFLSDDKFVYFKDYKNNKGDMYVNKTKIDFDVYAYSIEYNEDFDEYLYFTDWNSDKRYGTLKVYKNGSAEKIGDDIYDCFVTADGSILYLYDYSLNYYKGELHIWKNGEERKLDEDVMCIIKAAQ